MYATPQKLVREFLSESISDNNGATGFAVGCMLRYMLRLLIIWMFSSSLNVMNKYGMLKLVCGI